MAPQTLGNVSLLRRAVRTLAGSLALVIGLYFLACLAGSFIGDNDSWRPPEKGVRIYVETNGIHTAIVMPRRAAGFDWSAFLPASDLADPLATGDYISFSWGHRRFYLDTETWGDIKLATVTSVIVGSDETLMHVYHQNEPREGGYVRGVKITDAQYLELVRLIESRFKYNADGTIPPRIAGYGKSDVFYEATGRYTLINTCNAWTGRTLSAIGLRVGTWTPMAGGVMRWFPQKPSGGI